MSNTETNPESKLDSYSIITAEVMLASELRRKIKRWSSIFFLIIFYLLLVSCGGDAPEQDLGPHVAKVTIDGVIESDKQPWYKQLQKVVLSNRVKGLVLVLDSPGGVVHVAEASHSMLQRIRSNGVPIVAVVRSQATSAAYLLASAADAIVANETSILGSIGVKSSITIFKEMLTKLGISVQTTGVGQSLTEVPFSGISPFTQKFLDLTGEDSYTWFKDAVQSNRHFNEAQISKVVGGKIFTGSESIKLGLIDYIGDLQLSYSLLASFYPDKILPTVVDYSTDPAS